MDAIQKHNIYHAMMQGSKIDAIKELRSATGVGLKEAKDIIELFWDSVTGTRGIPAGFAKYYVFSRRRDEDDWQRTYIGNTKAYAMDDARNECLNDKEALLVQVVAQSKYVMEEV